MIDRRDDEPQLALSKRARGLLLGALGLLVVLGFFLPNVAIVARPPKFRWLPGTSNSFLLVTTDKLDGVNAGTIGVGFTVTFLGLALWQLGLLITVLSAWVLASSDVNRWLWIFLLCGTIVLCVSISTVVLGKVLLDGAGAPTSLGIAWLPSVVGGVGLLAWTLRARRYVDRSWYQTRPELIT